MGRKTLKNFGKVIEHIKNGGSAQRVGWNGIGMLIKGQSPDKHSKMSLPYIYISTTDGKLVPWVASQTDILSEDWILLED